jgi:hypothetical protein
MIIPNPDPPGKPNKLGYEFTESGSDPAFN